MHLRTDVCTGMYVCSLTVGFYGVWPFLHRCNFIPYGNLASLHCTYCPFPFFIFAIQPPLLFPVLFRHNVTCNMSIESGFSLWFDHLCFTFHSDTIFTDDWAFACQDKDITIIIVGQQKCTYGTSSERWSSCACIQHRAIPSLSTWTTFSPSAHTSKSWPRQPWWCACRK